MVDKLLEPFYKWLAERRHALLVELEEIEKLLGTSPRTSELRRMYKKKEFMIE